MPLISELRKERVIHTNKQWDHSKFCVFFGVFNAMPHINRIEKWLKELDLDETDLYICDNSSTDGTLDWFRRNLNVLGTSQVSLIQNSRNLGGYGNLVLNLDLIEDYEWVTTLHQDDEYFPNHCQLHRKAAASAPENIGAISSEAISINVTSGVEIPYPRLSWLLPNRIDEASTFLSILQNHFLPFSGGSFRTKMLRETPVAWHNAAFPDSELILKAIPRWKFVYLRDPTVRYFENPNSESHSIYEAEREMGIALSLIRVFKEGGFSELVRSLDDQMCTKFLSELQEILSFRIRDRNLYLLLNLLAHEVAWASRDESFEMLPRIKSAYGELGSSNTLNLFNGLGKAESSDHLHFTGQLAKRHVKSYEPNSTAHYSNMKGLLLYLLGWIPRKYRPVLLRVLMSNPISKRAFPQWKFRGLK